MWTSKTTAMVRRISSPPPVIQRQAFEPALAHIDEDVVGVRRIQREESPRQAQQVLVVVHPFIYSQFNYGSNGLSGVKTEIAAVVQSIDRDRSHRIPLLLVLQPDGARLRGLL